MATRRTPRSTSSPGGGASLDREKPSTLLSESSRLRSRRRAADSDSRSVSPTPTRGRRSLSNVSPSPTTSRTRRIRTSNAEPDQVAPAEKSGRSRSKGVSITTPSPRKSALSASRKAIDTTTPEVTPTKQSRKRRREEDDEEQDNKSASLAAEKSDGEKSLLSAVKNSGRKLLGSLADVIAPKRPKVSAGQPHPDLAPESDSEDGNSIASSTALAPEELQLNSAEKEEMTTSVENGATSSSSEFLRKNNSDELTDIQKVKRRVLGQLNGRLRPRMVGLETVYGKMYHLIEQTILAPIHAAAMAKPDANTSASAASISLASFHGGNSALLLGPRGSGKSLVIDSVLADLHRKYRGHFITVRLSGLAQTDDKLALHEIALQIERGRREIEEGETADGGRRVYRRQSANRTLSRLVTMLSGRSGLEEAKIDNDDERDDEDDDDSGAVVSVVIILDEFERFATMQNRQTLLYNLLDAAQSPRYSATSSGKTRAPSMCIIGMSSRMTVPEMLEKRVRSRFSHRVVLIPHPYDVEKFWSICEAAVTLESGKAANVSDEVAQTWNAEVQKLSKAPSVQRLIRRVFATTRDPRQVHVQLAMCVRGCTDALSLSAELVTRLDLGATEGAGAMERVAGLSELGLMLLVCAARAEIKYGRAESTAVTTTTITTTTDDSTGRTSSTKVQTAASSGSVNFAIAYGEYMMKAGETRLAEAAAGAVVSMPFRIWSREQAAEAWEGLEKAGLIQGTGGSGGMSMVEVSLRELATVARGAVVRQWCKSAHGPCGPFWLSLPDILRLIKTRQRSRTKEQKKEKRNENGEKTISGGLARAAKYNDDLRFNLCNFIIDNCPNLRELGPPPDGSRGSHEGSKNPVAKQIDEYLYQTTKYRMSGSLWSPPRVVDILCLLSISVQQSISVMDLDDDNFDELAADSYSSKTTASLAEFFRTTSPPGFVDPHPAAHRPRSLAPQVALQYSPSSTTPRYTPLETVRAPDHEEMQSTTTPRTLHRAERIFKLTTDNRPHYDDLSCIFSVLIISLPLMDHFVGVFSAPYPLSFKADDAVSNLMNLKMQQNVRSTDGAGKKITSTTITSYQVDRPMCLKLMQYFMSARFIKCANDPSTEKFSESLLLQLTPKGCAVLYLFTQRNGISAPNVTSLLKHHSSCMRLVTLERDPLSDYIYTSSQFVEIVFQRFAGTSPNYYHSSSSSSSGHSAHHSKNSSSISISIPRRPNMPGVPHTGTGSSTSTYVFSGKQRQQSAPPMSASEPETVPDPGTYLDKNSDSGTGVSMYEYKRLHLKEYRNFFSGADARRWIMDWTTAINNQEAQILLDAFVDQSLIVRLDGKSGSSATSFIVDKNAHYTLASKGRQLAGWSPIASRSSSSGAPVSKMKRPESPITRVSSPGADKKQKLNYILESPALRLLFREHLEDHLCAENLLLYLESSKVIAMYDELARDDFASATIQKVDICISEAWVVYHVFLAHGSASEVNIDYDLRTRVREGMTAIRSPNTSAKEKSPKSLDASIANLKRIISLLIEVRSQVFSLMAADSVPKFLKTSKFLESNLEIG